jgi:hypothetical protein
MLQNQNATGEIPITLQNINYFTLFAKELFLIKEL